MAATQTIERTETLVLTPEQQDSKAFNVLVIPAAVESVQEENLVTASVEISTEPQIQTSFLDGSIRLAAQLVRPLMAVYG